MPNGRQSAPRCAAFVGPYLSGKTTLMEALLATSGAIGKQGSVTDGSSVGDSAPEARARQMGVELNVANATYLGERWSFLDCPGSIEFLQEAQNALMACDVAVVVCEPVPDRALTLAPILKFLDDHDIPHLIFVNKMDTAALRIREVLAALQAHSARPLVLRQVPIREGDSDTVTGYVDLVSERAYRYRKGQPSDLIQLPDAVRERHSEARNEMLERLADYDDKLLEQLLEDVVPPPQEIYQFLGADLRKDLIVPVLLGAAIQDSGVTRLWKALRHEVAEPAEAAARRGIPAEGEPLAQVVKTVHAAHTGKLSIARVWRGSLKDGMTLNGTRVSGLYRMMGSQLEKIAEAEAGEVVALGRMEPVQTGQVLTPSGSGPALPFPAPLTPVYALAIRAESRNDEVKLSACLTKLVEEDPSLAVHHDHDTNELVLAGQGDIHLQVACDRLRGKYNLKVTVERPSVPYKETIRRRGAQHARHKKQTGGHGQFGDVKVEIEPLPRGSGIEFVDRIVGGAIPRNYIPSVEEGVRDFARRGPLGFPMVDFRVVLVDGQFHSVDSSDMAFKTAARLAMSEGLPKCEPVLLEPVLSVDIHVPSEFTAKVQRIVTGRRGQILGFDARPGWKGWDSVTCHMPQSEIHDLIIELRSLTQGVGSYDWRFDHLSELQGRLADQIIEQSRPSA
ncbi:MAG: elongation factor G [Thalassobaculales bacterium]